MAFGGDGFGLSFGLVFALILLFLLLLSELFKLFEEEEESKGVALGVASVGLVALVGELLFTELVLMFGELSGLEIDFDTELPPSKFL